MVGVAQGCLIGGQAHEAARDGRGGERLALAERAKPGRLGAHDLVEGEERRAGRERRLRRRTGVVPMPARPARQGLPEPWLSGDGRGAKLPVSRGPVRRGRRAAGLRIIAPA